ncbi:MAG: hypothetical protein KIH03_07005 [Paludibacteraceae bacterium]|nr:hypothetical protein [Paludibacteraceae bacterium]
MGELLKFVAYVFIIALILVFAIPLIWLVIKLFIWLFGGLLAFTGISIWFIVLILAIVAIIAMCNS